MSMQVGAMLCCEVEGEVGASRLWGKRLGKACEHDGRVMG